MRAEHDRVDGAGHLRKRPLAVVPEHQVVEAETPAGIDPQQVGGHGGYLSEASSRPTPTATEE